MLIPGSLDTLELRPVLAVLIPPAFRKALDIARVPGQHSPHHSFFVRVPVLAVRGEPRTALSEDPLCRYVARDHLADRVMGLHVDKNMEEFVADELLMLVLHVPTLVGSVAMGLHLEADENNSTSSLSVTSSGCMFTPRTSQV